MTNTKTATKNETTEWNLAHFEGDRIKWDTYIETNLTEDGFWYLAHDVCLLLDIPHISILLENKTLVRDMRMIEDQETKELRYFIEHDALARLLLRHAMSLVA
ncbi:hypothetical protein [Rhizobium sp. BK538]|uniref:hypothetical protein n=1 Tax=Rhizobium sp. BK538 TaxID=2586984 RepID=UPI001615FBCE|nr:hypothetical protein [Rhizobium sp. BK538]MBB4171596.1 hypothetical protein [Rhizobium sp. BK538]